MIIYEEIISQRVNIPLRQVKNTVELLEEGATIPFISRYRKEHTGSLDEVKITEIRDELNKLKELQKRQEYILKTIDEQELLTPDSERKLRNASTLFSWRISTFPISPSERPGPPWPGIRGWNPWQKS